MRHRKWWWLVAVSFVLGLVIGARLPGWWRTWTEGERAAADMPDAPARTDFSPPRLAVPVDPPGQNASSSREPRTDAGNSPPPDLEGAGPDLRARSLTLPVAGVSREDLRRSFRDRREGAREHQALDILAPRNTPVLAVEDGTVVKLFESKAGGLTVYQFDPTSTYAYLLRAPGTVRGWPRRGRSRQAGPEARRRRYLRQCAAQHAAPALCDLSAHRQETLVGRQRRRPV